MTDHLSQSILNALADGELSDDRAAAAQRHLAECPACTSNALHRSLLKSATAKAGRRYVPPADLKARLFRRISLESSQHEGSRRFVESSQPVQIRFYGWATACALALALAGTLLVQSMKQRPALGAPEYAALTSEAIDQHIAVLAASVPPQVVSSDRHTVKPWFQGKLPFSFNLPENLPSGTTLDGANLTYIDDRPTAQLLYMIGKHRVSVYLQQRANAKMPSGLSTERSGFYVASFSVDDLEGVAVGDVDPARLSDLAGMIAQAQAEAPRQSK